MRELLLLLCRRVRRSGHRRTHLGIGVASQLHQSLRGELGVQVELQALASVERGHRRDHIYSAPTAQA